MKHIILILVCIFFCVYSLFSQSIDCTNINEDEYFAHIRGHSLVCLPCKDSIVMRGEGAYVFPINISGIQRNIHGRTVFYKDDFYYKINGISVYQDTFDKIVKLINKNEIETYIELVYLDTCTLEGTFKLCFDTKLKISILIDKQEYGSNFIYSIYGETLLKDEKILSIRRKKCFFKKDYIEILLK